MEIYHQSIVNDIIFRNIIREIPILQFVYISSRENCKRVKIATGLFVTDARDKK